MKAEDKNMQEPKLFALLPDYVSTPDGMAIDADGNLILSCPNYADTNMPGCVVKIDKDKNITKWFDVPVHPETGCARNMGIAFGPDWDLYICDNQGWSGEEALLFKGRVLRVRVQDNKVVRWNVVADGMEHPNGIRVWGEYMYVTQSLLSNVEDPTGLLMSCVYRFHLDDENIHVTNTLADKNILTTFITHNPECQYGADGIVFDKDGNLYVGNFGDGAVHKITFNENGSVRANFVWAQNPAQLQTTDGMIFDEKGNLYIADFSANAIGKVSPEGTVTRYAQSPDADGFGGELDQPGEPCIWQGKIVVSCFDLVTGPDKVNTKHEMPATMSQLDLE
jgi:sugar lactone lactonase YvrE